MELDCKQIKYQARQSIALPRPPFWAVTLVYLLVTTGVSAAVDLVTAMTAVPGSLFNSVGFFLAVLTALFTVVVDFGYTLWALWTQRRLNPGMGSLLEGFSVAGRVIWMQVLISLRTFCWALPLGFAFTLLLSLLEPLLFSSPLLMAAALLLLYAAVWAILLRYALAPYLLADRPDDGGGAAVRRSVELMRNWKWQLFRLEFSFFGWELLALALSGAVLSYFLWRAGFFPLLLHGSLEQTYELYLSVSGSPLPLLLSNLAVLPLALWLLPYRAVSRAGFYEHRMQYQRSSAPPL